MDGLNYKWKPEDDEPLPDEEGGALKAVLIHIVFVTMATAFALAYVYVVYRAR